MNSEINNLSGSFAAENKELKPLSSPESIGSGKARPNGQIDNEHPNNKNELSYFNNGTVVNPEINGRQISLIIQEEKERYKQEIQNQKNNYRSKADDDKNNYIKECDGHFGLLNYVHSLYKQNNMEEFVAYLGDIEKNPPEFLSSWGPKRCLIYLKLASIHNITGNCEKKNELLKKAKKDLSEMSNAEDKQEISTCKRWLCLQRIENRMKSHSQPSELDIQKERKLFDKFWGVKQRHFEGRKDFLDFYTIFLAKHMLRKGDYKMAERAYKDALILRRDRKKFWDKEENEDDFDWRKLEDEVKKDLKKN